MTTALSSTARVMARADEPDRTMITVVSAHARQVPSAAREAYAAQLAQLDVVEGLIVLHTCHRVDLYIAGDAPSGLRLPAPPRGARRIGGAAAVRHLISTACGLESAVLGEDQILHQIRQTLATRRAAGPLDPSLDRMFQMALQAGRRARDWFGSERRSLGDVALDEIQARSGALEGRTILVVGAGSMARLTALAAARRGAAVLVTNRTARRAQVLAADVQGETVPWASEQPLPQAAGVIVALSGRWPITAEQAREFCESGAAVVDLSSPPATPDDMQSDLGDRFVSVDDLAWGADTVLPEGLADRLDDLVSETGRQFCRWLRACESRPAIRAMTDVAEQRRRDELDWLFRRLPNLSPDEALLIERMSHRLVGGILHGPLSALRLDDTGDLGRAARELFGC